MIEMAWAGLELVLPCIDLDWDWLRPVGTASRQQSPPQRENKGRCSSCSSPRAASFASRRLHSDMSLLGANHGREKRGQNNTSARSSSREVKIRVPTFVCCLF